MSERIVVQLTTASHRPTSTPSRSNESGVTLIELVVAVSMLGLVIALIFGALSSLTATDRRAQNRVAAQEAIRTALTEMARDLRSVETGGLVPPTSAEAARTSISFKAPSGATRRWRLDQATKSLVREELTGSTWNVDRRHRNVRNFTDATPLLRYFGASNQQLDPQTQLGAIAVCSLRLRLQLKAATADVEPYSASVDVALRNRGSRGVPAGC